MIDAVHDRVVGVEISQGCVKAVVLTVDNGMPVLEWSSEAAIAADGTSSGDVNPLYIACERAVGSISDELIVSAVDSPDVLVRQVQLDVAKDRDIEAVLDFQIEPLLPFPLEEAVVDHVVLERANNTTRVGVLTVQKARLEAHLDRLRAAGLEPERTSCVPAALAALLYRLLPSEEPQGVLHFGEDCTTCAIVQRGKVLAIRAIPFGANQLTALTAEQTVNCLDFDVEEHPQLEQLLEQLRTEVAKTFFSLTSKKHRGTRIVQIFRCGEFARFHQLDLFLARALDLPLTDLPQHSPFCAPLGDTAKFAVPLGLALLGLPLEAPRIDFRKKEFAYPKPWRRIQGRLLTYFGICIALAAAVVVLGKAVGLKKERILREEYGSLSRLSVETFQETQIKELRTPDEIVKDARRLATCFRATPETFPLVPEVPRVSDVLAWIVNHPKVTAVDPETGEKSALVCVDNFQYVMVKHPTPRNPSEKYQVRVDLEFSAENPTVARELHDALLEPNPYIDGRHDIRWSNNRGKYRTSFYLKDFTRYPRGQVAIGEHQG